jgi:hypothetical protein
MADLRFITTDGSERVVVGAAIDKLASQFRGELVTAADRGYDAARRVWNAMVDKRPALIARCTGRGRCRRLRALRSRARPSRVGSRRRP